MSDWTLNEWKYVGAIALWIIVVGVMVAKARTLDNVDHHDAWLRSIHIPIPARHLLTAGFVLAVALVLEVMLYPGRWWVFAGHPPVLVATNDTARVPSHQDRLALIRARTRVQQSEAATAIAVRLAEDTFARRPLRDALGDADYRNVLKRAEIALPIETQFLTAFSVEETLTSETPVLSLGWLSALTTGPRRIEMNARTWCGFDLTVTPASRACFAALPAPIFTDLSPNLCREAVKFFTPAAGGYPRTRLDPCLPRVRVPHLYLKMTADGVTPLGHVSDTKARRKIPDRLYTDKAPLWDDVRLSLNRGSGHDTPEPLTWAQFARQGTPLTVTVALSRPGRERPIWSYRQATRNTFAKRNPRTETAVEKIQSGRLTSSAPVVRPEDPENWHPFTERSIDVAIPYAHAVAARFLGHDTPWLEPAPLAAASRLVWSAGRVAVAHTLEQGDQAQAGPCMDAVRKTIALSRNSDPPIATPPQISTRAIRHVTQSGAPDRLYVDGVRCLSFAPMMIMPGGP